MYMMRIFKPRQKGYRGFTIVEILVVIAIISVLASVVMAALWKARVDARDKSRIVDLNQATVALRLYAEREGTYQVSGAGNSGTGQGWFSYQNGTSYPASIAETLFDEGLLPAEIHDPLVPAGQHRGAGGHRQYMNYFVIGGATVGTCLFAQLEDPSAEEEATFSNAPISESLRSTLGSSYSMNYAACVQ